MRIGATLDVYERFIAQIAIDSFPLSSKNPNQISTANSHSNKGTRNSGRMCSENRGAGSAIMRIKINDDGWRAYQWYGVLDLQLATTTPYQ